MQEPLKPIDISKWAADARSVLLTEDKSNTFLCILTGTEMEPDGNCYLVALSGTFVTVGYSPVGGRKFGTGYKQYQFIKPDLPEVKAAIERIQEFNRYGPLGKPQEPEQAAFGDDDGSNDNQNNADRSGSANRVSAVKATRPR